MAGSHRNKGNVTPSSITSLSFYLFSLSPHNNVALPFPIFYTYVALSSLSSVLTLSICYTFLLPALSYLHSPCLSSLLQLNARYSSRGGVCLTQLHSVTTTVIKNVRKGLSAISELTSHKSFTLPFIVHPGLTSSIIMSSKRTLENPMH